MIDREVRGKQNVAALPQTTLQEDIETIKMLFLARRSYASAVLGVVILSVCRPSVRLSHALL